RTPNVVEPKLRTIVEMADNRTMEELLQAPMEGDGEAIVINADHFVINTNLLQLIQAYPYHGFERENPHTHINNFKRITSTLKFRDVPNDVIKLVMFSYSLKGTARVWENSSKTDDRIDKLADQISTLVDIFAKKVVTHALVKAVEESCVTCGGAPAYYNCLNTDRNQPSVCVATGTYNQVALKNRASNFMAPYGFAPMQNSQNRKFSTSSTLLSNTIPNPKDEMKAITTRSGVAYEGPLIPIPKKTQPGIPNELSSYMKSNETLIKNIQNQINVLRGDFNKQEENLRRNLNNDMRSILGSFFQNQASTSGTLPSNIVPNPKGEMKAVTTRSGLAYEGPSIPTNSPLERVVERDTEEITDKEQSNCQGSTAHIQPPVVPISISEPDVPRTQPKPNIPYPSRLNDQKLREKATNQMEKL
nr:reverse transcriptase domain-containing protein [Tanacetum cinerariifolium]